MTDPQQEKIQVLVHADFSDELMVRLREVSPRLNVRRVQPNASVSDYSQVEILFTWNSFPEPEQAPRLRWIQLSAAGVDRALGKRIVQAEDVLLTNASGIHVRQMANHCLLMVLAFHHRLPDMFNDQREKAWREDRHQVYAPSDLHQKTLGIVGYGSIGRELARLAQALGMQVLASKRDAMHPAESGLDYTPEGTGDPNGEIPARIYPSEALGTMASECDFLVVLAPLVPATHHLVNERVLKAMKPDAVLINVARGPVVDEKALVAALQNGKLGGAALDVFEEEPLPASSPLWQMPNVIITPHVSGNAADYNEKCAELFIENLRRYLEKRPLLNRIDRERGY